MPGSREAWDRFTSDYTGGWWSVPRDGHSEWTSHLRKKNKQTHLADKGTGLPVLVTGSYPQLLLTCTQAEPPNWSLLTRWITGESILPRSHSDLATNHQLHISSVCILPWLSLRLKDAVGTYPCLSEISCPMVILLWPQWPLAFLYHKLSSQAFFCLTALRLELTLSPWLKHHLLKWGKMYAHLHVHTHTFT